MSRRTWLVFGILAVAAAGTAFLLTRGSTAPPPLDVSFRDIEKVQAYPIPEGTSPPALVRSMATGTSERSLARVRAEIPSPFPAPVRCNYTGFGDGLQLSVWLQDGRRLNYFACAFPDQLRPLYEAAWR